MDPHGSRGVRAVGILGGLSPDNPIEVFDRGWALWNLSLVPGCAEVLEEEIEPHVAILAREWQPGYGIASAIGLRLLDGDDTTVVFVALHRLGYELDVEAVLAYKTAYHVRCYPFESNPSTSINVHILDTLRQAGLLGDHPGIQTALLFLRRTQTATAIGARSSGPGADRGGAGHHPRGNAPTGRSGGVYATMEVLAAAKGLKLTVEIAEDVPDIFREALQSAGYETLVIRDGQKATDRLAVAVPDLIVLDLHLSRVSGMDILR